jgi:DNA-directed RNA polymerase subunit M/transcription elongation factor TFIIS
MSERKFYQAVLVELDEESLMNETRGISIKERMGDADARCPECGYNKWWLLPKQSVAVLTGKKSYCECLGCGHQTHL